jgi:ribonuclease P protein component
MAPPGPPATKLATLKRRTEFLRIRHGLRWSTAAFVIEAKSRAGWTPPAAIDPTLPRFGLTVTKQLGSAVHRNRIRRRLRAALQATAAVHGRAGFDYVVIARAPAEGKPFDALVADFVTAFERVHTRPAGPKPGNTGFKSRK